MIRIDKIKIEKFRGIIDLELDLKGENFAACGPNGTGKSGIVDAIEFALTGNLSRLSGRGTGELSVKLHGPHVDYRKAPEQASVRLEVSIPSLGGKKASITRTVKSASSPTIIPPDADVIAAFQEVKLHPEFVLSRRELIRYIIAEPGDRADEVQALLRLGQVEKLRSVLNRISNACAKECGTLDRTERGAIKPLADALGIEQPTKGAVLGAVNPKREMLGVALLTELTAETSLSEGIHQTSDETAVKRVPKAQAARDVQGLKDALLMLRAPEFKDTCTKLAKALTDLSEDPVVASGMKREALLNSALELYDDEHCPVCDTPFTPEAFTAHLKEKLAHLDEVADKRKAIEEQIGPVLSAVLAAGTALRDVIAYGPLFEPKLDLLKLTDFKQTLLGRYGQLQNFLPLIDTAKVLSLDFAPADLDNDIAGLDAAIARLPEPDTQVAARDFLLLAQERLQRYREARKNHEAAKARAAIAERVYKVFGDTTTKALESIYEKVQDAFAEYYREINKSDEGGFTARLIPSLGKLGFDVDFYGRGQFPPGAFHSEGHQDGMGVCLYLALMNHLLGKNFTFAVLDDVLMSVDRGHRREVCALLKKHFPHTQFIMTTHDEVWLRHMKSEALIKGKNFAHFKTWTIDLGPAEWSNDSVWEEIDNHLSRNEVSKAAAALRHFLEYFAGEMCHRLRGTVEYRGDGNFGFGDLITGAANALADCFKKAKASANSWNNPTEVEAISAREKEFRTAREAAEVDKWQLNAGVHYNPWADLAKEDFLPVVAAQKAFVESFSCKTCGEPLSVLPEYKPKEVLKCLCGETNLNLVAKGNR